MVKNLKVVNTAIFLHGPHLKIFSYVGQSALSFARLISFFCFKTKSYFQRHVITAGSKELALKVKQYISKSDSLKSFL